MSINKPQLISPTSGSQFEGTTSVKLWAKNLGYFVQPFLSITGVGEIKFYGTGHLRITTV